MRLIILKFLYFLVVMWQLMWITYMSREFICEFLLYSYRGCVNSIGDVWRLKVFLYVCAHVSLYVAYAGTMRLPNPG
jgi:hypothetical protein